MFIHIFSFCKKSCRCIAKNIPMAGLEPAIPGLGNRCLIHQATRAACLLCNVFYRKYIFYCFSEIGFIETGHHSESTENRKKSLFNTITCIIVLKSPGLLSQYFLELLHTRASLVQWQNARLPRGRPGFDSRTMHQTNFCPSSAPPFPVAFTGTLAQPTYWDFVNGMGD